MPEETINKTHRDVLTDHSNIIFSTKCRIIFSRDARKLVFGVSDQV